jgi:hypothetical protein
MRALVLTTSYPLSEESLSGRFIEELLHGLVPHGWSFHVVTPASPDGPRRFTSGPVTIEAVGYPGYRSGLVHDGGMPDRLALAPWLAAAVPGMTRAFAHAAARRARTEPLDLIWSHWLLPAGWIGAGLARATGLPPSANPRPTAPAMGFTNSDTIASTDGAKIASATSVSTVPIPSPAIQFNKYPVIPRVLLLAAGCTGLAGSPRAV